jgi:hypothetical protein
LLRSRDDPEDDAALVERIKAFIGGRSSYGHRRVAARMPLTTSTVPLNHKRA